MPYGEEPEYPPLWPAGFHQLTISEVRKTCVEDDRFALSTTRAALLVNLESVVTGLLDHKVSGIVWLDGKFVTEELNPPLIEFILVVASELYDNGDASMKSVPVSRKM